MAADEIRARVVWTLEIGGSGMADKLKSAAHRASLEACWKVDLDWNLYPKKLVDVSIYDVKY